MPMEVFQPAPILPSNAPPWADNEDSILLQEQCRSKPFGFLPSQPCAPAYSADDADGLDEYNSVELSDSHFANRGENHGFQPREQHNSSHHVGPSEAEEVWEGKRLDAEARKLAARISQCEGYIKYRNRQPKGKKGQKWPDALEDAFLRGSYQSFVCCKRIHGCSQFLKHLCVGHPSAGSSRYLVPA